MNVLNNYSQSICIVTNKKNVWLIFFTIYIYKHICILLSFWTLLTASSIYIIIYTFAQLPYHECPWLYSHSYHVHLSTKSQYIFTPCNKYPYRKLRELSKVKLAIINTIVNCITNYGNIPNRLSQHTNMIWINHHNIICTGPCQTNVSPRV